MSKTVELARHLEKLHINNMYKTDFYWTWDKTDDEIDAVFTVADALRDLRERNKSTKIFNSGLGISLFRDNSTRTRFSFASACNFLGLEEQVLDEKKSQIAHGETVRETANMVSFMADVIGIRDDMYIHQGHEYQKTFMDALEEGYRDGILEQRPTLVNLQCDVDHPTQCMADMLHVIHYFGGVENLKGKKVAMTWAYSPSYGKPLSVPQGVIGLFTRFGMDVTLAHPEGYDVFPEVEEIARKNCEKYGSKFHKTNSMAEAFKDADIVYPKSWAPFKAMEKRSELYVKGDQKGIDELEKELLAIFERTYGAIRRRDVLPQMMLRSEDKREFLQSLGPADDFLLVDGYNILFAWDELKELSRTSLDTARHVLMNLLCNYQGYRGCTLILVFDAYKVPQGLGSVEKYHNIHIVYTRQAETADQYIERLSFELRGRRRVRVATSDNLEQLIILGHGAERISAQHFHDEVYNAQAEIERILAQNNQKNNG